AGSHAHFAGLLAAALGRADDAAVFLDHAIDVHERLGAATWEAASRTARQALGGTAPTLRRLPRTWEITFQSEHARVADTKGVRDLAILLSRPGADVHVLELAGSTLEGEAAIEMVDRTALAQYRQRLMDLDDDRAEAERHNDSGRVARAEAERETLLDELRAVTGMGGQPRLNSARAAERARKAVSARVRDAIRNLAPSMPNLAKHLDEHIVTGTWCRYRADPSERWRVEP
ncbi:MAG TPA: hypothetical protein VGQ20_15900, partial [Acidimicrobiales bacterium]|nr:hypothetical protein [Acidimicrobiales bacterium]